MIMKWSDIAKGLHVGGDDLPFALSIADEVASAALCMCYFTVGLTPLAISACSTVVAIG